MKTDEGLVIAEAIIATARIELERLEAQLADLKRRKPRAVALSEAIVPLFRQSPD